MHEMQTHCCVCLSVCQSVTRINLASLHKNGGKDRDLFEHFWSPIVSWFPTLMEGELGKILPIVDLYISQEWLKIETSNFVHISRLGGPSQNMKK